MLVGRSRELDALEALLESAAVGRGGVRAVHGEAGIGKTRLADEITTRAQGRGFTAAWGRAWETGGAPAYWPWIEALGQLVDSAAPSAAAPLPAPLARLLGREREVVDKTSSGTVEGTHADPARERFELFEAVSGWLRAKARRAPLLLVFDDLHTADVPTLELLAFVARGLRTAHIAVVATYRDAEARLAPVADALARIAREAVAVPIGPLSNEAVAEVVRHELGRFDGALAASLYELTEGNPLFLRETLNALASGSGSGSSSAWFRPQSDGSDRAATVDELREIALTGGVMALVRGRLAGASDELRMRLRTAAVLGRSVELSLFAELAGASIDAARRSLDEAAARGLLFRRGGDTWVFAHVLVREAFYEELPADARRGMHALVARVLERRVEMGKRELVSTLAHHALAGIPTGDAADTDKAVRTARLAAERARGQLAYEEAIALLERARAAAETFGASEEERAELLLALGWASTEAGQLARGRELFREVADVARRLGDARLLARAALGQGGEYVLAEVRSELLDVLREALAALSTAPVVQRRSASPARSARSATEGEAGDARSRDEERRLRARLLSRLAAALTPSITPVEPLALAREALAMTADETDAPTRMAVDVAAGSAFTDFAPPEERVPVNERLVRDARASGDRVLELRGLTRLACDHLESGDVASADAAITQRAALAEALGLPRYRWQTPLLRSMRAMPIGRWRECFAAVEEARAIVSDGGVVDPNAERTIAVHSFFLALAAGKPDALRECEAEIQRVMAPTVEGPRFRPVFAAAVLARSERDVEVARATLLTNDDPLVPTSRMSRAFTAETALLCGAAEWFAPLYASLLPEEGSNTSWGPFGFTCGPPLGRLLGALAFALGRAEDAERHLQRALALSERMGAVAHRAWVHLAWGEGLRALDPEAARRHLDLAIEHGEELDMPEVVERARRAKGAGNDEVAPAPAHLDGRAPAPSAEPFAFTIERAHDRWRITRGGRSFTVKDVRGMGMIARLVENAGREVHALDLVSDPTAPEGREAIDLGDAGEVLDAKARAAYKERIQDLRRDLEEAERFADTSRKELLQRELDALTQQLAAAVGLGGRERRTRSAAERARITVARRVREAIKRIAEHDPELGRHLDWTIRTGTFSAYEPEGRKTSR